MGLAVVGFLVVVVVGVVLRCRDERQPWRNPRHHWQPLVYLRLGVGAVVLVVLVVAVVVVVVAAEPIPTPWSTCAIVHRLRLRFGG